MPVSPFERFFQDDAREYLLAAIDLALAEDGQDLTSEALFGSEDLLEAILLAKEQTLAVGLPLIPIILAKAGAAQTSVEFLVSEGDELQAGTIAVRLCGPALGVLKAERIILNFICHLSGIANRTREFVQAMGKGRTRLLDTRKTLPGLRYPEKYAVLMGGGYNHRRTLSEMCMLKDNHIDRAGGIRPAIDSLRTALGNGCPAIEVECRTLADVREAVACRPTRIMLDNMDLPLLQEALALIPPDIESEVSGRVSLETVAAIAALGPDFISAGALTHSTRAADFSLKVSCHGSTRPPRL